MSPATAPQPAARPRMTGGINAGFGDSNEHIDEAAMQQALKQKQLGQQTASPSSLPTNGLPGKPLTAGLPGAGQTSQPRPIDPSKELLWMAQDIGKGILSLFDINTLLGGAPQNETPDQQAKKRQMHQRWQQMTQEEQAYAQQKYKEEMAKKQQKEQEKQQRRQAEEEKNAESIAVPSSPQKGPVGPASGNKKKATTQRLQTQRKQMSGPSDLS